MGNTFRFLREVLMSWKETSVMEERLRFVARLLEGEGMSDVCREFGISPKTGYKIFNRYKDDGLEALTDRSRRPVRYANQFPEPVEAMIVRLKTEKPHWGARNIRELSGTRLAGDVRVGRLSVIAVAGATYYIAAKETSPWPAKSFTSQDCQIATARQPRPFRSWLLATGWSFTYFTKVAGNRLCRYRRRPPRQFRHFLRICCAVSGSPYWPKTRN